MNTYLLTKFPVIFTVAVETSEEKNSTTLGDIIKNVATWLPDVIAVILVVLGTVLFLYTVFAFVMKLVNQQSQYGQRSIISLLGSFCFAAVLIFGGFGFFSNAAVIARNTVVEATGIKSTTNTTTIKDALDTQNNYMTENPGTIPLEEDGEGTETNSETAEGTD